LGVDGKKFHKLAILMAQSSSWFKWTDREVNGINFLI